VAAVADLAVVSRGGTIAIAVTANDLFIGGQSDPGTLRITTPAQHATSVVVSGGSLVYHSNFLDFALLDTLTYEICDTAGACGSALVTVTIL
jgi:hypothetical protein